MSRARRGSYKSAEVRTARAVEREIREHTGASPLKRLDDTLSDDDSGGDMTIEVVDLIGQDASLPMSAPMALKPGDTPPPIAHAPLADAAE